MASANEYRQNQRLYHEVNKRIREITGPADADGLVEFLCECGGVGCTATIELTETQSDPLFLADESVLVATEHRDVTDGRRVIAENGHFVLAAAA